MNTYKLIKRITAFAALYCAVYLNSHGHSLEALMLLFITLGVIYIKIQESESERKQN